MVPRKVSADDRLAVISWLRDYKSKVHQLHPSWVTKFSSADNRYVLDIVPTNNTRELFEKGQNLKDIWTDEIANRA